MEFVAIAIGLIAIAWCWVNHKANSDMARRVEWLEINKEDVAEDPTRNDF